MYNDKKKNLKGAVIGLSGLLAVFVIVLIIMIIADKKTGKGGKDAEADRLASGSIAEVSRAADIATPAPTHGPIGEGEDPVDGTVYFNGEQYVYNSDLINILFLGIDKKGELEFSDIPGTAGQSDCIMLLTLNKKTKEVSILQISRDTMVNVDVYDKNGNYKYSSYRQLTTQFAYGNGKDTSCWATKMKVQELLYGIPIEGYICIDIDAIRILNDAVGGVDITIPEDYTSIDPAFVQGTTITLTGEQAEKYVRYRDINEFGSNNGRMRRQVQYIPAMIAKVRGKLGGTGLYERFYPLVENYMVTDLSADMIDELADYNLNTDSISYLPGENVEGERHDEFHVDDDELQNFLIKTLYKRK